MMIKKIVVYFGTTALYILTSFSNGILERCVDKTQNLNFQITPEQFIYLRLYFIRKKNTQSAVEFCRYVARLNQDNNNIISYSRFGFSMRNGEMTK